MPSHHPAQETKTGAQAQKLTHSRYFHVVGPTAKRCVELKQGQQRECLRAESVPRRARAPLSHHSMLSAITGELFPAPRVKATENHYNTAAASGRPGGLPRFMAKPHTSVQDFRPRTTASYKCIRASSRTQRTSAQVSIHGNKTAKHKGDHHKSRGRRELFLGGSTTRIVYNLQQ